MVAIDERLEGVMMRPRKSMNKFEVLDQDVAPIEIARWFEKPGTSYLNRQVFEYHLLRMNHKSTPIADFTGRWS